MIGQLSTQSWHSRNRVRNIVSVLQELRRRKVFRVAAVYVVVAWGILQVIDVVSDPLNLPPWFDTVSILLLAISFPIALILGWAFDIGPDGLTRTDSEQSPEVIGRGKSEIVLLLLVMTGIGWLIFKEANTSQDDPNFSRTTPVVILWIPLHHEVCMMMTREKTAVRMRMS